MLPTSRRHQPPLCRPIPPSGQHVQLGLRLRLAPVATGRQSDWTPDRHGEHGKHDRSGLPQGPLVDVAPNGECRRGRCGPTALGRCSARPDLSPTEGRMRRRRTDTPLSLARPGLCGVWARGVLRTIVVVALPEDRRLKRGRRWSTAHGFWHSKHVVLYRGPRHHSACAAAPLAPGPRGGPSAPAA